MNVKRSRATLTAVILAAAGMVAAVPASAGGHGFHGGFGHDLYRMERLADKLDLSDAQRADFQRISDQSREQARPYVRQMIEQHKAMRKLMESDTFDEAAVRALAERGEAATTELAVIRARSAFEIRKILTPEQREKMAEKRRHHRHPE